MSSTTQQPAGAWSPFQFPAFALLWTAALLSNTGSWMHDVAAGWLMTTLAPTPFMVALVQAATTLPVFLLALPAGALADRCDRRRLMMLVQACMLVLAALLGILVLLGDASTTVLLLITFGLGIGTAISSPTWQAILPQLVPAREHATGGRAACGGRQPQPRDWTRTRRPLDRGAGHCVALLHQRAVLRRDHPGVCGAGSQPLRPPLLRQAPRAKASPLRSASASRMPSKIAPCATRCCARSPSISSPAPTGRCCRWWRGSSWVAMRACSASSSAASAPAP